MRTALAGSIVVAACIVPAAARADGGSLFGAPGQLSISDDQPLASIVASSSIFAPSTPGSQSTVSVQYGTVSAAGGSGGGSGGTEFTIAPSGDYFIVRNFSAGAEVLFGVLTPAGQGGTGGASSGNYVAFGVAPRVGYNVPIGDVVSFWPKVYFGYQTLSSNHGGGSIDVESIGAFLPLLFHLAPHFFVGLGPNVSTVLGNHHTGSGTSTSEPKVTQFGLQATLGGWCLGD